MNEARETIHPIQSEKKGPDSPKPQVLCDFEMKAMSGSTPQSPFGRFFRALGPGLVTGAADDDPSGIATYSIAGAQHGTRCFGRRRLPGR